MRGIHFLLATENKWIVTFPVLLELLIILLSKQWCESFLFRSEFIIYRGARPKAFPPLIRPESLVKINQPVIFYEKSETLSETGSLHFHFWSKNEKFVWWLQGHNYKNDISKDSDAHIYCIEDNLTPNYVFLLLQNISNQIILMFVPHRFCTVMTSSCPSNKDQITHITPTRNYYSIRIRKIENILTGHIL